MYVYFDKDDLTIIAIHQEENKTFNIDGKIITDYVSLPEELNGKPLEIIETDGIYSVQEGVLEEPVDEGVE